MCFVGIFSLHFRPQAPPTLYVKVKYGRSRRGIEGLAEQKQADFRLEERKRREGDLGRVWDGKKPFKEAHSISFHHLPTNITGDENRISFWSLFKCWVFLRMDSIIVSQCSLLQGQSFAHLDTYFSRACVQTAWLGALYQAPLSVQAKLKFHLA